MLVLNVQSIFIGKVEVKRSLKNYLWKFIGLIILEVICGKKGFSIFFKWKNMTSRSLDAKYKENFT